MIMETDGGTNQRYDVKRHTSHRSLVLPGCPTSAPLYQGTASQRLTHWFPHRFLISSGEPLHIVSCIGPAPGPCGATNQRTDVKRSPRSVREPMGKPMTHSIRSGSPDDTENRSGSQWTIRCKEAHIVSCIGPPCFPHR